MKDSYKSWSYLNGSITSCTIVNIYLISFTLFTILAK